MATTITSRPDFKNYCLKRLGFPVIDINIDDDQVEDRIDDALQFWHDYHFDGLQKVYYIKKLTQTDIDNRYLDLTEAKDTSNNALEITGVTRIFPISDSQSSISMFDLRYQLRLNELYDFTSASYINYTLTQQHLRTLELMFTGETPIRFNRHTQKLMIDWGWGQSQSPVGTTVIAEAYALMDPDQYGRLWNDRWLKEYATALIKKQWGSNLKKFSGVQLPGGVTLNGETIFNEANDEIMRLEADMEKNYGGMLEFYMN
jgi:hypothetical protein